MARKHQLQSHYFQDNDSTFYVLQDDKDRILGFSEIEETEDGVYDLKYLESNTLGTKKYVGQALLASVAEDVLCKNGTKLTVNDAVDSAFDFYSETFFFEEVLKLAIFSPQILFLPFGALFLNIFSPFF